MRSPSHLLTLLTLALTNTPHTTAAAQQQQQQQQQPSSSSHVPILCPNPSTPTPSNWPGYAFTLQYSLNYDFLSAQPAAAAQLCQAGGSIVAYALTPNPNPNSGAGAGPADGAVTWGMEAVADEVAAALGYVAATLVVRAPPGVLAELNEQVGNATARLYGNPDALARQVAAQIDDAFEVVLREGL